MSNLYQDAAVQKVVEFMDAYSLSQEDFDTIVELSKFQVGSMDFYPFEISDGMCSIIRFH